MAQVAERPAIKDPNNEDEMFSSGAAAHNSTRDLDCGSGANQRKPRSDAGIRDRPRGCCSIMERRLHDRPRSKPVRSAHVGLREPSLRRAIQESVLTLRA
jgi:hypothetical protein